LLRRMTRTTDTEPARAMPANVLDAGLSVSDLTGWSSPGLLSTSPRRCSLWETAGDLADQVEIEDFTSEAAPERLCALVFSASSLGTVRANCALSATCGPRLPGITWARAPSASGSREKRLEVLRSLAGGRAAAQSPRRPV